MESITPDEVREGQRVRVHYSRGTVREGVVERHDYYSMVFKQEDGSIGALFDPSPEFSPASGWSPYIEEVELIHQPQHPHNRTDLDRLADATAEVERLQTLIKQRDREVSLTITREAEATAEVERLQAFIEQRDKDISSALAREQDITETLDDLKRDVGAEWVRLAEMHGWDMDTVERAIDHLDLEMPKPKPVTFTVTLDLEFTATPANREVAKQIDTDRTTDQITAVIEEALTGLGHVDLNENVLELDVWRGMNVEVRDVDVTD